MKRSQANIVTQDGNTSSITIEKGVRQGDALSIILFNIALNRAIESANIRGSITHSSRQLIARDMKSLEENLLTKYMSSCRKNLDKTQSPIQTGKYKFEEVNHFIYLGVTINGENNRNMEIKERIKSIL
ncbi:hypothetical protein ILUMI_22098 [Ignelater luminosus]|uniref:Reverse transcriptase domain-containing protein n=1 Tax=Ignelater luminosus TaxID=2038154 RepID=A0A8K0CB92_IGNLU|nr:hypothetical protein ILUMI_22098 [Ignelater luminosus]